MTELTQLVRAFIYEMIKELKCLDPETDWHDSSCDEITDTTIFITIQTGLVSIDIMDPKWAPETAAAVVIEKLGKAT